MPLSKDNLQLIKRLVYGDNAEGKPAFDTTDTFYLELSELQETELPSVVLDLITLLKNRQYFSPGNFFKNISDEYLRDCLESWELSGVPDEELPKYSMQDHERLWHKKCIQAISLLLLTGEGLGLYSRIQKELAIEQFHLLLQIELSHRSGLCRALHRNFTLEFSDKPLFEPVEPC